MAGNGFSERKDRKHYKALLGALPSPTSELISATQHIASGIPPAPNFLAKIGNLSTWGNVDTGSGGHGDCVTAEEAFAKGCGPDGVFISDDEVVRWATKHGVLEGARLSDVLKWMRTDGFQQDSQEYEDGAPQTVNWTNAPTLQSAIARGPVKIGVGSAQLTQAWQSGGFQTGWFATGLVKGDAYDHCAGLCGYGTLGWLAQQLGCDVPDGVDGSQQGYAIFTWGSIGIIDAPSMLAVTHEAWLRQPTTVIKSGEVAGIGIDSAKELRTLLNTALAAGKIGASAGAHDGDFCAVWVAAKPVLQFLAGIAALVPGLGSSAGATLNALITAGQAVYDQTCGGKS